MNKKRSTPKNWIDEDEAPELTQAFFDSADLYEDKKIDVVKNNIIYQPTKYPSTRYLPVFSNSYEKDYYYEVVKPAQDALQRDFEDDSEDDFDDDDDVDDDDDF